MTPTAIPINKTLEKYDQTHDVLHVYFPPTAPSYDDEVYPGIVIRKSMHDERITGITILGLQKFSMDLLRVILPFLDKRIYQKHLPKTHHAS